MGKYLKVILLPTILLILIVGCLVPVYNTLKEERCNLALMTLLESDLLNIKSADLIFAEHPDSVAYLMNHPKTTLKICLDYEAENPEGENTVLIHTLTAEAYSKVTSGVLPKDKGNLKEMLQATNPELYKELTAE